MSAKFPRGGGGGGSRTFFSSKSKIFDGVKTQHNRAGIQHKVQVSMCIQLRSNSKSVCIYQSSRSLPEETLASLHVRIQRGDRGSGPPGKLQKI